MTNQAETEQARTLVDMVKALQAKWLALATQQMAWSKESDAKQDGANSHTERARARIYRECASDLDTLLAASSAGREGWQPIETAPKDGTQVMLWIVGIEPRPRIGYWADRGIEYGWFGLQSQHFIGVNVTHWQPLPPPPSAVREEKKDDAIQEMPTLQTPALAPDLEMHGVQVASVAPHAETPPQCVCTVDDSLVQEWVSKAREVAKSKGSMTHHPQAETEQARTLTTEQRELLLKLRQHCEEDCNEREASAYVELLDALLAASSAGREEKKDMPLRATTSDGAIRKRDAVRQRRRPWSR